MNSQLLKPAHTRALDALAARRAGWTLKQIAEKFGVTREGARQLSLHGLEIERALASDEPKYELSTRSRAAIVGDGCKPTPNGLLERYRSVRELKRVPNIGKKCVAELQAWLIRHGKEPLP
jgi:hypothetical protein